MESSNKDPHGPGTDRETTAATAPKRRFNPTLIALLAAIVLLIVLIVLVARGGGSNQDALSDNQLGSSASADPESRCSDQDTYDLIKRELFRRAAQLRGSDQAAFDRLSAHSSARMDSPVLRSDDEEMGTISCEGGLSLDLPPGVAVVGGRRTLSAEIGYTLQTAADGSGDVVTLTNADAIITPLATLARVSGSPTAPVQAPSDMIGSEPGDPDITMTPEPPQAPEPPNEPEPAPQPSASANPSFNCGAARTRGEIAVCNDSRLAALDRQMAAQFNSAMSQAAPGELALLTRTRSRFLAFRDSCGSDSCIADAYRGRMREISDIMAGRWTPPR